MGVEWPRRVLWEAGILKVRSMSTARKGILGQGLAQGYTGYGRKIGKSQCARQELRERERRRIMI